MDFGQQIKTIRKEKKLTQEQFATQLHVSRQAVSNWENNKNLPDIEMLIQMSHIFDISLDQLLKGENNHMNNITEKVIKDGSETRKAKYNMVTSISGGIFLLMGLLMLVIKGMSVEYVDAQGILHENFFLLPLGFLSIFCGLILFVSVGIRALIEKCKAKSLTVKE